MTTYTYTISPFASDSLAKSIRDSAIVTSLSNITSLGSQVTINFNGTLSGGDEAILSGIVAAHTGIPLPENTVTPVSITALPDPQPFAVPAYRTKRDSTSWTECPENTTTHIDFLLTAERYAQGGEIIFKDSKEGDYLTAEVRDINGIIPEAYRAALCEAHPTVASYVIKYHIMPTTGYGMVSIDTYPLNAKISAGLYLRVSYHASSEAGTRKAVVNYYLSKKL
jgi:hypothetical protein